MKSQEVYNLLIKIPKGKVATYGELARVLETSPRAVGQILKANGNPGKYPCFRVVRSNGKIGGYFGHTQGRLVEKKISLLRKDGIEIRDGIVNLKNHGFRFA